MANIKRRWARTQNAGTIRILGKTYDVNYARIVFRCGECLSELERHNHGLRCKASPDHRRFIHRKEAAEIERHQEEKINQLSEIYAIEGGKVVIKCQSRD